MILLAKRIKDRPDQPTLGLIDITVERNAFGRQVDSFESDILFDLSETEQGRDAPAERRFDVKGVFIRAPYIVEKGEEVETLGIFDSKIVAVRQSNLLATAFHPELTADTRVHEEFVRMISKSQESR